ILQTASNPYITIIGPPESAAKRISIMGICNKLAGASAPIILGFFLNLDNVDKLSEEIDSMPEAQKILELNELASRVIAPYIGIFAVLIILAFLIYKSSLPEIDTDHEDETVAASNTGKQSVFEFPHVLLGVLTIFLYVGVEVMAGDSIITYGKSQG